MSMHAPPLDSILCIHLSYHPSVSIHVDDLTNIKLLGSCLRGCNTIFSTVASNTN
jgi:hypothetical protein